MTIGLPGCGKTTYLHNLLAGRPKTYISGDWVRQEVTGSISDLSQDGRVWQVVKDRFDAALRSGTPESQTIVLDATHLTATRRKPFLKQLQDWGQVVTLKVMHFTADLETCLARQQGRARQVPEEVVRRMDASRTPFAPTEAPPNVFATVEDLPAAFTLPNPERVVDLQALSDAATLERTLTLWGFWREGSEWSSGRAARIVFGPRQGAADPAMTAIIDQLVAKGFASRTPDTLVS
jgi:predicted kinase